MKNRVMRVGDAVKYIESRTGIRFSTETLRSWRRRPPASKTTPKYMLNGRQALYHTKWLDEWIEKEFPNVD